MEKVAWISCLESFVAKEDIGSDTRALFSDVIYGEANASIKVSDLR